ncbi:hypothetical protein QL285_043215 [Trifolium repens]|nr:hypothetical protein QL285_043215 [Trifolium repens]
MFSFFISPTKEEYLSISPFRFRWRAPTVQQLSCRTRTCPWVRTWSSYLSNCHQYGFSQAVVAWNLTYHVSSDISHQYVLTSSENSNSCSSEWRSDYHNARRTSPGLALIHARTASSITFL